MANPAVDSEWETITPSSNESDWETVSQPQQSGMMDQIKSGLKNAVDQYGKSQFGSPSQLLQTVQPLLSKGAGWLGQKATEQLSQGPNPVDPYTAAGVGTAIAMAPDVASLAAPESQNDLGQEIVNSAYKKVATPFLKSTKGIPANVSRMAIDNPIIFKLPGTSESIQGKSQSIIDAIKEANNKVGSEFGNAYKEQGILSPVDQIINGKTPVKSIFKNRSYEVPGEEVARQQNIPGRSYQVPEERHVTQSIPDRSYQAIGSPEYKGINPSEPSGITPGERVTIPGRSYSTTEEGSRTVSEPGRSYTYLEEGPNKTVSIQDVAGTKPNNFAPKSFDDLRNDYHAALSGDLFKKLNTAGGASEMPTVDKLSTLTELKRSLQNEAIYPQPGQQLSPSQGARNAAIKKMASDIDQIRGNIPGGEKLALADEAWSEMTELKHRLMSAFKDPYTGQDYLNRILKGNTDWLTSGRNAGRMGAIERIEQLTGKKVLQPALEEMAASYLKNPDVMGLPSTGLKAIVTSLIPKKMFLSPPSLKVRGLLKTANFGANRLLNPTDNSIGNNRDIKNTQENYTEQPNNNGNEQQNQNADNSNSESLSNHPANLATTGKVLTREIAKKFLDQANGDKDLARELARKAGYSW